MTYIHRDFGVAATATRAVNNSGDYLGGVL